MSAIHIIDFINVMWKLLKLSIAIAALIYLCLAITCHRLKYSSYFNMSPDDINAKIVTRQKHALISSDMYFNTLNSNDSLFFYDTLHKSYPTELVVIVITNKRSGNNDYLKLTMKALDVEMKNNKEYVKSKYGIKICNVNFPPKQHYVAQEMSKYFPMINIYDKKNLNEQGFNILKKETNDYVSCLSHAFKHEKFKRTKSILVLEDDVVPNVSRYKRIWLQNMELVLRIMKSYNTNERVTLVKLLEPDRHR